MMDKIKIATINISGVISEDRKRLLLHFCNTNEYDLVGLQEVSFMSWQPIEDRYQLIANPGPGMNGTAILARKDLPISNISLSADGRISSAQILDFTFMTIYAPSGTLCKVKRSNFFRSEIPAHVANIRTPLVMTGDFNSVDEAQDRKKKEDARRPVVVERALIEMVSGLELVDLWKAIRKNEDGHTFIHRNGSARLDRIYCSRSLRHQFVDVDLRPNAITDHFALETNLSRVVKQFEKKKENGIWKMNASIMNEEAYAKAVEKFITNAKQLRLFRENVIEWWDKIFKNGIKKITQDFCKKRAQRIRETKLFYQNCLKDLAPLVGNDEKQWREFQALREEARRWETIGLQGTKIRSRQTQSTDTDDPSIFHIAMETTRARQSKITRLEKDNETVLEGNNDIDEALTDNFKTVFSTTNNGAAQFDEYFLTEESTATSDLTLTEPLVLTELTAVVEKMGKNKSPGEDGIPYEFYSAFWKFIGPIFFTMFNKVLQTRRMSNSQGNALIRLLPKIGTPKKVTDFRPLSLLNCDYKIMAGVLANRLKKTLANRIEQSQRGGIPGRRMTDNLSLYRDVISFVEERTSQALDTQELIGPKAAIIGVDLEKAYDLVDRQLLWRILKMKGIPEEFIYWIETLYSVATMSVLNGSRVAGTVSCNRSLRQGCPLSIHLFVVYLEPLLTRLNKELSGLQFLGTRIVSRAYVDDLALFISKEEDFLKFDAVLQKYCKWTGARINQSKTRALGIGSWRERTSWPISWLQSAPTLKLLGIAFSPCIDETSRRMWNSTLAGITGILKSNYGRCFTLYQRVEYLKSVVFSKAVFMGQTLSCPKETAKNIQTAMMTFLWAGKILRPKAECTFRPIKSGGLGMIDTELFLKALFTRPILLGLSSQEHNASRSLLRYWLSFPIRKYLEFYKSTPPPVSYFKRPSYLSDIIPAIKQLVEDGLMTQEGPKHHRIIYQTWIAEKMLPGAVEKDLSTLNWPLIWKGVAKLPHVIRETFFMFNHKILYTRERRHRLNPNKDANCIKCKNIVESDTHMMAECASSAQIFHWLSSKLNEFGCQGSLSIMVRGEFGKETVNLKALKLVAAFVHTMWKTRNKRRLPTPVEIEKFTK